MKRLWLLLLALPAFAAPPYDVTVNVTAPTSGGSVDSYVLYLNGVSQGAVTVGANSFPGLLTADGLYVFEVAAVNALGETRSAPVQIDARVPGAPSLSVTVAVSVP